LEDRVKSRLRKNFQAPIRMSVLIISRDLGPFSSRRKGD
jgi:hypothetical protein